MKRIPALLLCALLLLPVRPACAVDTAARAAVLVEAESGRVLYEHSSHERRAIASITKLMTALVALESGHPLQDLVKVPAEAVGAEGSSLYLRQGEELSLEALLYGLLLHSGNDAALALAISCAGSTEAFVERMNARARTLGMADTHFMNPNGLTEKGHYSSAYDMALLTRACLDNETLAKIAATKEITIGNRALRNHNKLLWRYEGCIGMKTGYTELSGRTLVSAARRDGMTLIAVTLCDPEDWRDHMALLDWGFERFQKRQLVEAGEELGRFPVYGSLLHFVPVVAREGCVWPTRADETLELSITWNYDCLQAPIAAGTPVGVLRVCSGGEVVAETLLEAAQSVPRDLAPPGSLWESWLG